MDDGRQDEPGDKTIVAISAVALLLIGGLVGLYFAVSPQKSTITTTGSECDGIYCELADRLIKYRKDQVKPCHNFYQSQCGNFGKYHKLNQSTLGISTYSLHMDGVRQRLKSLLDSSDLDDQSLFVRVYRDFYRKCSRQKETDRRLKQALVGFDSHKELTPMLVKAIQLGIPTPFEFETVRRSTLGVNESILLIRLNPFWKAGEGRKKDFYLDLSHEFFLNTIRRFYPEANKNTTENIKSFVERCKVAHRHESRSRSYKIITSSELGRKRQSDGTIYKIPAIDTQKIGFNFVEILDQLGSIPRVMIEDEEKWSILVTQDFNVHELRETLRLNAILAFGPFVFPEIEEDRRAYERGDNGPAIFSMSNGARGDWCLEKMAEYAPYSIGFIMKSYERYDKQRIQTIFDNIQRELKSVLSSPELTETSSTTLIDKVTDMKIAIGTPDWTLKQLTAMTPVKEGENLKLLELALRLSQSRWKNIKALLSVQDSGVMPRWTSSPLSPHSHYSYFFNTIELSPASLTGLIYDGRYHDAYNYPTLGFIIARQMMHALDEIGRYFDSVGTFQENLEGRYKELMEERYNSTRDIYRDFGSTTKDITRYVGNHLPENFADFNGQHLVVRAFKKTIESSGQPPKIGQLNSTLEETFFAILANSMCEETDHRYKTYSDEHGLYAQGDFRLNVPASHNIEFTTAYKCLEDPDPQQRHTMGVFSQRPNFPWFHL